MNESGHYSIAGFFFQLLASAGDALKLYFNDESNDEPTAVFLLEKLGQDGVVKPVCGNSGRTQLVQYKYSSVGAKIGPNDLRKILNAFRGSVKASGSEARDFDFCLTTNRELDDETKDWIDIAKSQKKFKEYLHKNLDAESAKEYPHTVLYPIFRNLEYEHRDLAGCRSEIAMIANRHGMHDHEVKIGINTIVGFLNEVASSPGEREITRQSLIEKLLGRTDPMSLTGNRSLRIQQDAVKHFKDFVTDRATTTNRAVFRDIADAASTQPFVLVQGEGGCGKSVAMSEAAQSNLASRGFPPGFAFVVKAADLSNTSIQISIADWRNQVENPDQNLWKHSLSRLERALPTPPCLAIYVDGVDERHRWQSLPPDARNFLSQLIFESISEYRQNGVARFSVIVACRNEADLRGLSGGGFGFPEKPASFLLSDFSPTEILTLASALQSDKSVVRRITSHLSLRHGDSNNQAPSSEPAVEPSRMNIIYHPVLWRCFAEMSDDEKHRFLDGKPDALAKMASGYIRWFYDKIEKRVGDLMLNAAQVALTKSAQRFMVDPTRIGFLQEDWLEPCAKANCPEINRDQVFQEAVSAGVIEMEDKNQQTWKWKRPWLCEFLAKGVSINV